jgi:hypothetical protein
MKTIIGLGQAGCNIAEKFKKYPQYKIYKIDVGLKEANSYAMRHQNHPELYESKCPNLKTFLKEVSNEVLFITSSGDISGALLRILEQIKIKADNISVLYIRPDLSLLPKTKKPQENVVFHVLQEYARSAALKRAYLVDNALLTEIVGDVPIKEHYNYLNEAIASTMHMINVFDNSNSVLDNFSQPIETARIFTFGLVNIEEENEKMFFDLQMPREKKYYYAYPEEAIESDGTLMKKIKKHIKKNTEHDKMKISYGIYSTNYEQPYVYCLSNSTLIQESEKNT